MRKISLYEYFHGDSRTKLILGSLVLGEDQLRTFRFETKYCTAACEGDKNQWKQMKLLIMFAMFRYFLETNAYWKTIKEDYSWHLVSVPVSESVIATI